VYWLVYWQQKVQLSTIRSQRWGRFGRQRTNVDSRERIDAGSRRWVPEQADCGRGDVRPGIVLVVVTTSIELDWR